MIQTVATPVERLSWTRTAVVAVAAAGFLFVAEPIAAIITLVFTSVFFRAAAAVEIQTVVQAILRRQRSTW